jgi:hypothetical protein
MKLKMVCLLGWLSLGFVGCGPDSSTKQLRDDIPPSSTYTEDEKKAMGM